MAILSSRRLSGHKLLLVQLSRQVDFDAGPVEMLISVMYYSYLLPYLTMSSASGDFEKFSCPNCEHLGNHVFVFFQLTLDIKKIREENSRLRRSKGSLLDDDSVLDSIEASFKQFHNFLDLLRDAG